jgi:hypothetical protein
METRDKEKDNKMKYEIVNPSDQCFIEHAEPKVAIASCLVLGRGYYGLKSESGELVCPITAFSGTEEFLKSTFGGKDEFLNFINLNTKGMAEALESVNLTGERSSMNDIKSAAAKLAINYRTKLEQENKK